MDKKSLLITSSVFFIFVLLPVNLLFGIAINYNFKAGYKYNYKISFSSNSRITSPELTEKKSSHESQDNFSLNIIDVNKGIAIVDISNSNGIIRRYLRNTGQIISAPTESGSRIPFFITFPSKDWAIGEKIQISKVLKVGNISIPSTVDMLLKSINEKKGTATILFKTSLNLPQTKLRTKEFSMKGKLIFSLEKGCVEKLIFKYNYKFSFDNKEIAVIRHLWTFQEENQTTVTLKEVKRYK